MKKRLLAVLLCVSMALVFLSSCGELEISSGVTIDEDDSGTE